MATLENPFAEAHPKLVKARITLMSRLAKFSHDQLTMVPTPGEWSALVIAYHIYITDGLILDQLQLVQEKENPEVTDTDDEARRLTLESQPPVSLDAVLGGMAARREELFEYLHSLPADAWERPLRHASKGEIPFTQFVNVLSEHDQFHAHQLEELKAALTPIQS